MKLAEKTVTHVFLALFPDIILWFINVAYTEF